jgi:hypothetical protein
VKCFVSGEHLQDGPAVGVARNRDWGFLHNAPERFNPLRTAPLVRVQPTDRQLHSFITATLLSQTCWRARRAVPARRVISETGFRCRMATAVNLHERNEFRKPPEPVNLAEIVRDWLKSGSKRTPLWRRDPGLNLSGPLCKNPRKVDNTAQPSLAPPMGSVY